MTFAEEAGRDEGSSSAGSVCGKHQVELVVDPHQLTDPRFHDVRKVRVESKEKEKTRTIKTFLVKDWKKTIDSYKTHSHIISSRDSSVGRALD